VAASPGASQVSLCPIFDIKIYKEFSGIFLRNFIFEDFSEIGILIKLRKTKIKQFQANQNQACSSSKILLIMQLN
jgi:hypothetical protein